MIVPMLKFRFLVYHKDIDGFLQRLRELQVAHIATVDAALNEKATDIMHELSLLKRILPALEQRTAKPLDAEDIRSVDDIYFDYQQINDQLSELEHNKRDLLRSLQELEPWGEIPAQRILQLQEHGTYMTLFSCPASAFNPDWSENNILEQLNRLGYTIYFALFSDSEITSLPGATHMPLPSNSLEQLRQIQIENSAQKQRLEEILDELAAKIPMLKHRNAVLESQLEWESALHQTKKTAGNALRMLQVWVPKDKAENLRRYLAESDVVWLEETPTDKDEVPILLKNNKFSHLFHPIGELFSLPSYSEMDLTPFFAPFFTLFFGMCLGDVGYGLLILLGLTALRVSRKFPDLSKLLILGQFLGSSAVIFGLLTGTVFGADLSKVEIPWLESLKIHFLNTDQLFNLSLMIGLFQILFGMALRVVNRSRMYGWLYGLSGLGWIFGIVGGGLYLTGWSITTGYVLLLAGLILILFFSDPSKGIFTRVGLGLWDLYGITGLFGDVLSYVRLFALGLSSGILGLVVNNIAFSTIEGGNVIGYLFFVIILLFGHWLNFAISTLSAFVHPIRLTFVEFYKNAGFIGGGSPYQPFGKKIHKSNI